MHPFYSPVKGWSDAVQLRAGDILVLVNGEYVVVEKVQHEILEAPVTVYNFQVEDFHTYYITIAGVLVHNSNCTRTGGGHGNPEHSSHIEAQMDNIEGSGEYCAVFGNKSLNTAGQVGNQRPDIIAIKNNGAVEAWEYASPSQAIGTLGYKKLMSKIGLMQSANPSMTFYFVSWE